jgi:hypothetical protein
MGEALPTNGKRISEWWVTGRGPRRAGERTADWADRSRLDLADGYTIRALTGVPFSCTMGPQLPRPPGPEAPRLRSHAP